MVVIMEFRKYKDRNKRKLYMLIIISFLLISFGNYLFYKSYALYEEIKNFDVINGSVEDPGDIYFAYYIDGEISREMPSQNTGYTLDEEKSNCTNGVIPTWDNAGWKFVGDYYKYSYTSNTRTKCNLYFNNTSKIVSTILGNIGVNNYTPDFTKSACDDETCESHEKGVFETTDYDGNPTYYYRGSVENNYLKFAGYYWRIIRINSNGSIRMIYDGTTAHENGETSEDRQYGMSRFNSKYDDNMYVGYMYTKGEVHGLGTSSLIKNSNDKFYTEKLVNYFSKLDISAGYCGDRRIISTTKNNNPGIGTNDTLYEAYHRVVKSSPNLSCLENDYYTYLKSTLGNKSLDYPVGLISVDELMLSGYAGGMFEGILNVVKFNKNNYLITGNRFWTITPVYGTYAIGDGYWSVSIFHDSSNLNGHRINDSYPYGTYGLRPVINIRSDVTITGSGTMTDPYVVN